MDILIMMIIVLAYGIVKVIRTDGFAPTSAPVMKEDGSIVMNSSSSIPPVGNNLLLKRDPEAFTLILKEFDLL